MFNRKELHQAHQELGRLSAEVERLTLSDRILAVEAGELRAANLKWQSVCAELQAERDAAVARASAAWDQMLAYRRERRPRAKAGW